jgi:Icc-related predicted phosphoesterase
MPVQPSGSPAEHEERIRLAAAGDIHCSEAARESLTTAFAEIANEVDFILLAGDLTTHGEPREAAILAEICSSIGTPVVAVLGNHDWHVGCQDELVERLSAAGVRLLDRSWTVCSARGVEVGVVGTKGFVGGFPGSHLPDFGEPSLRQVYAETTAEVEALEAGLRAVATCAFRIVLLHYAPTAETLVGEPEAIWAFLGTDRLAPPILEHGPDLVLHGHAHAGHFRGAIGEVPVFNVSVPVMERDFWVFELTGAHGAVESIH